MNIWKVLLIGAALLLVGFVAFPLVVFLYKAFWFLFWMALLGTAGYGAYKLLSRDKAKGTLAPADRAMLEGLDNLDGFEREYQEIRRKYLLK